MKISVIIPVYNVAPYLTACLNSVVCAAQAVKGQVEVVCVDDGSTDGSGELIDEYIDQQNKGQGCAIKVLHQANSGVSAARNAALRIAKGEWIVFVDADDVVHQDMLVQTMALVARCPQLDILHFGHVRFRDRETPQWIGATDERLIDTDKIIDGASSRMSLWSGAFRRTIMPRHGFRPYCRGEDVLFVNECLVRARKVLLSHKPFYAYRARLGSSMRSPMSTRKLRDRIGYSRDLVLVLMASGKQIDQSIYRAVGLNMTEGFVFDILRLPQTDHDEMWKEWYSALEQLRVQHVPFPAWTSLVIGICLAVRRHWIARLLCALPKWLKKKGFHR